MHTFTRTVWGMWFNSMFCCRSCRFTTSLSLSLSLSQCVSPAFIFICRVMWEFWVASPTVQAICAPLSLSNHPTNTHSCTHTCSHSPPHMLQTTTHTHAHLHSICIAIKTCLCVHFIGYYSFIFPVSVLNDYWRCDSCISSSDQHYMSNTCVG